MFDIIKKINEIRDGNRGGINPFFLSSFKPELVLEHSYFSIYKPFLIRRRIASAWNNVVVALSPIHKKTIYLYPNYKNTSKCYKIRFSSKTFPGLISKSKIQQCLIVPFLRETKLDCFELSWRLIVITDTCQIFHNFPSRSKQFDGEIKNGDIVRFEESVIWDLPGVRFPSNKKILSETEYFNPMLNSQSYEYHPKISEKGLYGGPGFPKATSVLVDGVPRIVGRFYFPNRCSQANPFCFLGGYEPDYKMTLLGTYTPNYQVGTRICLFATTDGGRSFYAKYEFSDSGTKPNFGQPINGSIFDSCFKNKNLLAHKLIANSNKLIPDPYVNKETICVKQLNNTHPVVLETNSTCSLSTGSIIYFSCEEPNSEWQCLLSDRNSYNPNLLFKVKKIDDTHFELYELVSKSFTNLQCRHIHGINRTKDGWLITTGESYPEGWLLFTQMKKSDNWERINASEQMDFILLNGKKEAPNRMIGAALIEMQEEQVVVASDSSIMNRPLFFKDLSHNSTGIYKGRLKDIDDFKTFECICELSEPCYFFKELNNTFVSIGQRGEMAIGLNRGEYWVKNRLEKPLMHYTGRTQEFFVLDGWLLKINK